MATIEPRLIHLLNTPSTNSLPPIQPRPQGSGGFQQPTLPPLELDAGYKPNLAPIPPIYTHDDDQYAKPAAYNSAGAGNDPNGNTHSAASLGEGGLHIATTRPLQLLRGEQPETPVIASSLSLRMLVDDIPETLEDPALKKRLRPGGIMSDDFVQLPQPLKKQKSTQQVVPPIIAGLHEPPAYPAVFPPITGNFEDGDGIGPTLLTDASAPKPGPKPKKRPTKPRRKWTDEETNHLLMGVHRHGVGKWTSILEDPEFKFNDRSAGDLKDRFRTCCPDELRTNRSVKKRASKTKSQDDLAAASDANSTPKSGLQLEDLLRDADDIETKGPIPSTSADAPAPDSPTSPTAGGAAPQQRQKKNRAHRRKLEDLAELGINEPFKKSVRRERRPFTDEDDRQILDGLIQYGPAWTKIHRDPRFKLSSRQPTDLRDRVRNKYPEVYARIERGNLRVEDFGRGGLLEPSFNTTYETSLAPTVPNTLEPQVKRTGSKEDMPKWTAMNSSSSAFSESPETLRGGPYGFDMSEPSAAPLVSGTSEMDISRLLLNDSQLSGGDYGKTGGYVGSSDEASPVALYSQTTFPGNT